ncbi:hypothetical protein VN97_g3873 [Penicillium thymicola]|uniref:Uncharacterized protein n=1 Tax=Penicillium thymicola TaxID=293382 RepID=A0AAI9TLP2_PENTH|nr:hypothetical protein VN97_g3873 [Penicillium thymicola]
MPNYTHEAPLAWFGQQLTRWHINGQLTPAEHLNVMVTASPRVTASNPPYTGDKKEPDTFISYFGNPSLHEPRIVIEVGFSQTYLSLVEDAKLWLEVVGASVLYHWHITLSLLITYNSLPYKDSPTPKLAARRSANFLQLQFRFNSDSIYFRSPNAHFRTYIQY